MLVGVDSYLPTVLPIAGPDTHGATILALAAINRMADLLKDELLLANENEFSGIRILGRTILELWLNTNELLLDPEAAWDRIVKEDAKSQSQLQDGFTKVWDRYQAIRQDGIDLRNPAFEREESQRPNVEDLATRVVKLRRDRGFGSGAVADFQYQTSYRRDSVFDVHVTLDHLFRYINFDSGTIELLHSPDEDDINALRGPESIRQDARFVADIVGIYLKVSGQDEFYEAFVLRVGR